MSHIVPAVTWVIQRTLRRLFTVGESKTLNTSASVKDNANYLRQAPPRPDPERCVPQQLSTHPKRCGPPSLQTTISGSTFVRDDDINLRQATTRPERPRQGLSQMKIHLRCTPGYPQHWLKTPLLRHTLDMKERNTQQVRLLRRQRYTTVYHHHVAATYCRDRAPM